MSGRDAYDHLRRQTLYALNANGLYHDDIVPTCNPKRKYDCTSQCAQHKKSKVAKASSADRDRLMTEYVAFLVQCYMARLSKYLYHERRGTANSNHADQILLLEMLLREIENDEPQYLTDTARILLQYPFSLYLMYRQNGDRRVFGIQRVIAALNRVE